MLRAKARRRRAEAEGSAAPGATAERPAAFDTASAASQQLKDGPGAQQPTEPNWLDYVLGRFAVTGGVAEQGLHGVATGVENTLGLPGDLADMLNLGGVPIVGQLPTSDELNNLSRLGGILPERDEPQGWLETVVNRIGEEVGASAVPVGGIAAGAARMGLPAIRQAGGLTRHFLEPAAVDLPKFFGKEAGAATAAGLGAGVANTLVDRDTTGGQWADLLGALAGVGIGSAGEGVIRGLGDIIAGATGNRNYASNVVKQDVADALIANSDVVASQVDPNNLNRPVDTAEIVELLQRPSMAEREIPGFRASTADRAGDRRLALMEDSRAKQSGAFDQRREQNVAAIDTALDEVRPTEPAATFFDALEAERGRQLDLAQRTVADALAALESALGPLNVPESSTLAGRGNVVRGGLLDARDAAQARTAAAYDAADTSGNMVDPAELRRTLDNALGGMTQTELTHVPEATINRVRALGVAEDGATPAPVDLREATTLLSEIKELRRAAVNDGKRNANRVLGQIEDALDTFIAANVTPDQQQALDAARAARYDEAERFGRQGDAIAAALDVYPGGRFKMRDELVAPTFASRDANLDRLFAEADTPAVRNAIKEELLSRLDASSPETIEGFANTYRQQIARYPGLMDELVAAANARTAETAATTARTGVQRFLGDPDANIKGRSNVAKFLEFDETTAEAAMKRVLDAKKPAAAMDELMTFVGDDPAAIEGAREAFWRVMEKEGRSANTARQTSDGVAPWAPPKWRRFLNDPAVSSVMDRLYRDSPEHLQRIRTIAEALQNVDTAVKAALATNPSGTAQALKGGAVSLAEVQSKFYEVARGRVAAPYMITYLTTRIVNRLVSKQSKRAYEMLLDEALMNPEVAAQLLRENNPANRAALQRAAKGWLGNQASHLVELLDGEDEPTEADNG